MGGLNFSINRHTEMLALCWKSFPPPDGDFQFQGSQEQGSQECAAKLARPDRMQQKLCLR
jgi:hypothetical protein